MACQMDEVRKLHDQAVETMTARKVALSAENYMIWYTDALGELPDLSLLLRRLKASGETFTEALCKKLYERFFGHEQRIKSIEETCSRIEKTMERVLLDMADVHGDSSNYSNTLSTFQKSLGKKSAIDQMHELVLKVLSETQQMQHSVVALSSSIAASTAEISQLNEKLAESSQQPETDALTGIANRLRLINEFESVSKEAATEGFPVCLLMIDIDHFKKFNEVHGHQVGDHVLRFLAKTLVNCTKGRDLAARYGGEEFAVLLPKTDLNGAVTVANQIRESVAEKRMRRKANGEELGHITLSGGCARYKLGESFDSLVKRANASLHEAKQHGRNQVRPIQ